MLPTSNALKYLVCKHCGGGNLYEPVDGHSLLKPEGGSFPNGYRFWGPPQSPVRDSLKACHAEVASPIHIELLQGNTIPCNLLVGCWDQNIPHLLLREFHPEER